MSPSVDLNADLGESYGPWRMGDDAAMLDIVSSANVACGFHAGDPDVMARTMRLAAERGVAVGAHPGFADLQGFGRRRMSLHGDSLANLLRYQIGAARAMAEAAGCRLRHVKLHGALSNMAAEDEDLARTAYAAIATVAPDLIIVAQAATAMERAARALALPVACEIFADRAYAEDGTLVPRGQPGALVDDPAAAAEQAVAMLREAALITRSGTRLPTSIDTICLHGDTPGAVAMAAAVRAAVEAAGFTIGPMRPASPAGASGGDI